MALTWRERNWYTLWFIQSWPVGTEGIASTFGRRDVWNEEIQPGTISMHDACIRGSDLHIWMRQDKNLDIIVNSVENMHDWWVSNSQVDRQRDKTSDGSFGLANTSKQHDLSRKASLTAKLLHCGVSLREWVGHKPFE